MADFTLAIEAGRVSLSNPYGVERPSLKDEEVYRRKSVAMLLRTVALMLEQGRDAEYIRDHNGSIVGKYTMKH
jgi:hypothetical protein